MGTEALYLRDAYQRAMDATVTAVDAARRRIALDRTVFYPTGGGQPHDTGILASLAVTEVRKEGDEIWHTLGGGARPAPGDGVATPDNEVATPGDALTSPGDSLPSPGDAIHGEVDWHRRHALMRTHTALHVLCGVIWNEWGKAVTGGNMEPLAARMDFEFDPLPDGFGTRVEELVNAELAADRPIVVSFLPRSEAVLDPSLIRTKVSLVPESVAEVRVVDIVGLDRQADGGTHVRTTGEVGRVRVVKTESKGKGNKRVRIEVTD